MGNVLVKTDFMNKTKLNVVLVLITVLLVVLGIPVTPVYTMKLGM